MPTMSTGCACLGVGRRQALLFAMRLGNGDRSRQAKVAGSRLVRGVAGHCADFACRRFGRLGSRSTVAAHRAGAEGQKKRRRQPARAAEREFTRIDAAHQAAARRHNAKPKPLRAAPAKRAERPRRSILRCLRSSPGRPSRSARRPCWAAEYRSRVRFSARAPTIGITACHSSSAVKSCCWRAWCCNSTAFWRDGRSAAAKLDEVDEELHDLKTTAAMLSETHSPSSAFYAHYAGGANAQLLLADLKGQLDLLAIKIGQE